MKKSNEGIAPQGQPEMIIGRRSPEFIGEAIINGKIEMVNSLDYLGKYTLFFFYSNDFSVVCPTEMHALQERLPDFKKRNVSVIGASVDSVHTHLAWLERSREEGGIQGVTFTLLSDIGKNVSRAFCVLDEDAGTSLRGTFFIDQQGIVRYGSVNNLCIGRDIDELLRVIDALQFTEKHGELCPANWAPGQRAVKVSLGAKQRYYEDKSTNGNK